MTRLTFGVAAMAVAWSVGAAELHVAAGGSDAGADGSAAKPYATLVTALAAAKDGDTVRVGPGDYATGSVRDFTGAETRALIRRRVRLVSEKGADATRIIGRCGTEKEGLGPDAVRCVSVARSAAGTEIVGFTLVGGAARHTNGPDGFSGGLMVEGGRPDGAKLVGCKVVGCTGTRGAGAFGGSAVGTTFSGCRAFNDKGNSGGAAVRHTDLDGCRIENCRGMYVVDYPGRTVGCTFENNVTDSVLVYGGDSTGLVSRCRFVGDRGGHRDEKIRYEDCVFVVPEKYRALESWKFAEALQARIDAASAAGGGTVTVPPGHWVSEGFELKSGVTLEIPEGCFVEATTNKFLWPNRHCFVWASGATDVALTGKGTIDVHGELYPFYDEAPGRVSAVRFSRVKGLKVRDVTLKRSATWTLVLDRCEDVHVKGVKIRSTVNFNNDGIDIEAKRCLIEDCDIDSDDDAVCFKSNHPDFAIEDVEVRNCLISSSCNFIKFGTGSLGPVRRVSIHDCKTFARTYSHVRDYARWRKRLPGGIGDFANGIAAIALEVVDGGSMEDVTIRNIEVSGCQTPIFIRHAARRRFCDPFARGGFLRNILIENVKGSCVSRIASSITGVPGKRVENVTLRNIDLTCPGGATAEMLKKPVPEREGSYPEACAFGHVLPGWAFYVRHADGIRFENVNVRLETPDARKDALVCEDATEVTRTNCSF